MRVMMTETLKTISKVAQELGVEQHVLRFWEQQFSIIKPLKRNGRRLYNKNDINTLHEIKKLLYENGYTIKGVKKALQDKLRDKKYEQCIKTALANLQGIYDTLSEKYGV